MFNGMVSVNSFQAYAQQYNIKAPVFIFPGNLDKHHHSPLTCNWGGGLARAATQLSNNGTYTLSFPTQKGLPGSFDPHLSDPHVQKNILISWYLVGLGYTLVLPSRPHVNKTYFSEPIADTHLEPSFWGDNNKHPSPKTAQYYLTNINALINGERGLTPTYLGLFDADEPLKAYHIGLQEQKSAASQSAPKPDIEDLDTKIANFNS